MTPIIFMAGYALGLLLTFVRHPIYGLYTYFFAFYMAPSYGWWRNDVPDLRYMFIAGIAAVIASLWLPRDNSRPRFYETTPGKLFLMFVAFNWLQVMWAFDEAAQIEAATLFTKHAVSFYLIYTFANSIERIKEIAFWHVIGCGWFGYQALGAGGGRLETIGGPVAGSNELGVHITSGLIFGGLLLLSLRGLRRIAVFSVLPLIANCLILTISRGAFLGFFVGGLAGYVAAPKRITKTYLILGILGLVMVVMLSHNAMIERFTESFAAFTTEEEQVDRSAASRVEIAKAGIKIGLAHPFGAGSTATERMSGQYLTLFETGRAAHNTLAEVFAEHGFPGLILYVLIAIWALRTILGMRRTPVTASDELQEISI
ncbi:MAG: O-antigen ligase family protein [Pseudomonadota bacterium]